MTDYTELVKALLSASTVSTAWEKLMLDAAAAIEELQQIADHHEQTAKDYWKEACEYKSQLPKRGEWKPFDLTYGRSIYSCSVCEQATEVPMCMEKPMYAYCPNCGAKMEVQDADTDKKDSRDVRFIW